jgi:hypothetical protein
MDLTERKEINEAVSEIMRLTRAATSEHGVSVKVQLSEGLPHILGRSGDRSSVTTMFAGVGRSSGSSAFAWFT